MNNRVQVNAVQRVRLTLPLEKVALETADKSMPSLATEKGSLPHSKNNTTGANRKILLLQGPVGPFFIDLQNSLEQAGHETFRVLFNAADWVFSAKKNYQWFGYSDTDWDEWLHALCSAHKFDLIILFGCERDRHASARQIAQQLEIPVLCLEEGYIRPGFITAELGGNNRHSPLSILSAEALLTKPANPKPKPASGHAFNRMSLFGFLYFICLRLGSPLASLRHHKTKPLVSEAFFWVRNLYRKVTRRSQNFKQTEELLDRYRRKFFIVPLQVSDDMQLLKAGRGWTNQRLVESAIASFAAHAPSNRLLVFKVHPLERGHSNIDRLIHQTATHYNCANRVLCLDDGSIGLLARNSAGMLTVNSTSAFSAMLRRVPLGILGDAMFRRPDLAFCINDQADLDRFWTEAKSADKKALRAFRRHMRCSALLPGDFYLRPNRLIACEQILNRVDTILNAKLLSVDSNGIAT